MMATVILAGLCLAAIYTIKTQLRTWWAQAFWLLNVFGAVLLGAGVQMFFAPIGIMLMLLAYSSYAELGEDEEQLSRILEVGKYNPEHRL